MSANLKLSNQSLFLIISIFSLFLSLSVPFRGYPDPPHSNGRTRASIETDPILDPQHVDTWLMQEASPREKKEFSNVYDRWVFCVCPVSCVCSLWCIVYIVFDVFIMICAVFLECVWVVV